MTDRTVLISGAGIGGSTLAYWLARRGFRPTVVELAAGPRSSGNPVDVRGPAVGVAEQMGVMPRLRAASSNVTHLSFVNAANRRVARVDLRAFQMSDAGEIEIPRADLASILLGASRDVAEFLSIQPDARGVDVKFDRAEPRRFDLVIGADGLHSAVRRLAFGPESEFVHHMGIYVATLALERPLDADQREVVMYNTPGRAVSIHPSRGRGVAAFMFRSRPIRGFDHRDLEQHKRLLTAAFADSAWRVPELLSQVQAANDVYLDSVSQVRIPRWSAGRVALLGDAGSSVSLFGDGATLAIAGAFTLAEELASSPEEPETALRRYETHHRTLVDPKQRGVTSAAALLIPASRRRIAARNLATRLLPVATALRSRARHVRSRGHPPHAPE
jgi:2-polyprenyl-6-methoxyphenol hydroxylase-like FAD-dependent oxidoreductase